MLASADGLRPVVVNIEQSGDADPPSDIPLSVLATTGANIVDTVPLAEGIIEDDGRT